MVVRLGRPRDDRAQPRRRAARLGAPGGHDRRRWWATSPTNPLVLEELNATQQAGAGPARRDPAHPRRGHRGHALHHGRQPRRPPARLRRDPRAVRRARRLGASRDDHAVPGHRAVRGVPAVPASPGMDWDIYDGNHAQLHPRRPGDDARGPRGRARASCAPTCSRMPQILKPHHEDLGARASRWRTSRRSSCSILRAVRSASSRASTTAWCARSATRLGAVYSPMLTRQANRGDQRPHHHEQLLPRRRHRGAARERRHHVGARPAGREGRAGGSGALARAYPDAHDVRVGSASRGSSSAASRARSSSRATSGTRRS